MTLKGRYNTVVSCLFLHCTYLFFFFFNPFPNKLVATPSLSMLNLVILGAEGSSWVKVVVGKRLSAFHWWLSDLQALTLFLHLGVF